MCNLSQGVKEQGIREGLEQGIEQGIEKGIEKGILLGKYETALKMLQKQLPAAMIMEFTELTLEDIQKIADENQLTVVYRS